MKKPIAIAMFCIAGLLVLVSCSTISKPFIETATIDQDYMGETVAVQVDSSVNEHCKAGVAKIRSGNYEGAKSELHAAIADNEEDDNAHFALGVAYQATGDLVSAQKHYQRAVELSDNDRYTAALSRVNNLLKK